MENNDKCNVCEKKNEISAELVHNKQVPVTLDSCNTLCSRSGFEQDSLDNHNNRIIEISSQANEDKFLTSNSNELSESYPKCKKLINNSSVQEIQKEIQSNIYLPRKKFQSLEKISILDNSPFPYDADFKNPYFLKYNIFEDETIDFKDESLSNLISTSASSLSSLTIDDDNCSDNTKPNKAGLIKTKLDIIDSLQLQKLNLQENWRLDPIGSPCDSSQISKLIESKQLPDNLSDKFVKDDVLNQEIINQQSNTYSSKEFYQHQKYDKNRIIGTECNISDMKKSTWNFTVNQDIKNIQNIRSEAEGSTEQSNFRSTVLIQNICRDKLNDINQENQMLNNHNKNDLDLFNKCNKNIKYNRHKEQEFLEQNRFVCESYQHNNKINHSVDANNELNAYEEQLLDQCIRRGMAKVTKRNISDIKPFCWDLKQICLTTRAMLKTHDENIMRERQEESNKRHILHRGLTRHSTNSYTK